MMGMNMAIFQATRRIPGEGVNSWNWKSVNDAFLNGAFFKAVGVVNGLAPYQKVQSFPVANVRDVTTLTRNAGAIRCSIRSRC